jgi:UDP-N-acetylglucosamine acyltransferase
MLKDNQIHIDKTATIHPSAIIEGKVTIGKYTYIGAGTIISGNNIVIGDYCRFFMNIVIRGAHLTIGNYVNIFDNANIESGRGEHIDKSEIGDYTWINHGSVMHGSNVEKYAVIGMNASLNYHCHIRQGAIVMEGTACPVNYILPADAVAQGVPAAIIRENITDSDRTELLGLIPSVYIKLHAEDNIRLSKLQERS